MRKIFTSESVTEGHPDKLCDYISDSILDAYLEGDEDSRVAVETVASKNRIFITGEITSKAKVDIESVARKVIQEVGYVDEKYGMDYKACQIDICISNQSEDIALGVDQSLEDKNGENMNSEGAGDQGIMFGYATDETPSLMPMPIYLAHKLSRRLADARKKGELDYLLPDGKTQVTVEYDENDNPVRVDTIVVSCQHKEEVELEKLREDIKKEVIFKVIPNELLDENTKYYINPTGRFVVGGPMGDSGLTGRKIIVDTYGGYARHGGGAFSGKDATKVDRSASYMARQIAKNIVGYNFAKKCEVQLSYAIGVANPISIHVDTFGTSKYDEEFFIKLIKMSFDLTPRGIINSLGLKRPFYRNTTNYGHFGKENLPWERLVKVTCIV